jgi:hypothetical protein
MITDTMMPIIELAYKQMQMKQEEQIMKAVMDVDVHVDKERLIKALSDARSFYDEGYKAGQKVAHPRDVPMNPVRKYRRCYSDDYCPVCGKQQKTAKRGMEKPWFCERCGQKLTWEGFNYELCKNQTR